MYRDDEKARDERANTLIDEIAKLEREKVAAAAAERRLEEAKRELATLRLPDTPPAAPPADPSRDPSLRPPGLAAHLIVFGVAAVAAFAGYSLLF